VVGLFGGQDMRWVERRRSSLLYQGESDLIEAKGEAGTEVNVDFSFHRRMLCPQYPFVTTDSTTTARLAPTSAATSTQGAPTTSMPNKKSHEPRTSEKSMVTSFKVRSPKVGAVSRLCRRSRHQVQFS